MSRGGPEDVEPGRARLVLITGLSGSGKSSVAKCFEDLGYHTVDNLPLPLLREFLARPLELVEGNDRIAVVTDVRAPRFAQELPRLVEEIDTDRIEPVLVYLDATDEALMRRFSETRRPHPLADGRPLSEAIDRERELLRDLRGQADLLYDTSEWTIHEVRSHIYREFSERPAGPEMTVTLMSFGFKHGIPYGADLLFDVRFLPNPHFVPGLREQSGLDQPVRDYLEAQEEYHDILERLGDLLEHLLPKFHREHRAYLTVGIGCTGGMHRSVAVADALESRLGGEGWSVRVIHRDVEG